VRASEGGPGEGACWGEPFEIDMVVFVVLVAVAKAGFYVDAQGGMVWSGGSEEAGCVGVGFDDEGAFDDFDDVVEGVVYAFDEGAANVNVNAAGEEEEKNGGDGGIPEGEAETGSLKHLADVLPVSCIGEKTNMPDVSCCNDNFCRVVA